MKLNYTTRLTDIILKMFILHVKCNFDENFKDLLSYSNIFDERFFFSDDPTAGHFSTKTVHGRVLALSILMEIDLLIIVFIWLFVKGKDFSTRWFFPCENWWKIKDFLLFFHIFFANLWKFIETQGFLIGKIGRICKEMMIFEFIVVFHARKVQLFCAETCGKGCF